MKIYTSTSFEIDDKEVRRVAMYYLSSLKKEQWVEERDGKLVLREEHATSHRFDADVDYQDPVRIKIVKAVQDFERALQEYDKAFEKDGRK